MRFKEFMAEALNDWNNEYNKADKMFKDQMKDLETMLARYGFKKGKMVRTQDVYQWNFMKSDGQGIALLGNPGRNAYTELALIDKIVGPMLEEIYNAMNMREFKELNVKKPRTPDDLINKDMETIKLIPKIYKEQKEALKKFLDGLK